MTTSLAPSDSTVAAKYQLVGLTSFPPSMQALFVETWQSLLGVDEVEIISYSITTERRTSTVSVEFQAQAADASSVADMSSTMSSAASSQPSSSGSSFTSQFNAALAESADPAIASQAITGVVETAAPAIVTSPPAAPGADGAYGPSAESDDGANDGGLVLICVAAGAGLIGIVGVWVVWRQCCSDKPSSSHDVTVVLDASAPPNYNAGRSHPAPPIYNSAAGVGQYHGAAPPVYEEPVALSPVQGAQAVFHLQPGNEIQATFDYDDVQQNGRDEQPAPPAYNPQSRLQPGNHPVPIYVDAPDGGNQM